MSNPLSPRLAATLAALLLGTGLAGAALARPVDTATESDRPSVTVSFADLDVRHPAGARVLYQRLTAAARQVCPAANSVLLAAREAREACLLTAVHEAVVRIHEPALEAIEAGVRPMAAAGSVAPFAHR